MLTPEGLTWSSMCEYVPIKTSREDVSDQSTIVFNFLFRQDRYFHTESLVLRINNKKLSQIHQLPLYELISRQVIVKSAVMARIRELQESPNRPQNAKVR